MKEYLNKSGRSGVESYDVDADGGRITVKFKDSDKPYVYSIEANSPYLISRMSAMGVNGEYLNRLINSEQPKYEGQKGPSLMGNKSSLRPMDEKEMIKVHNKYQWRNESGTSQLKRALEEKQRKATDFKEFAAYRQLGGKLR